MDKKRVLPEALVFSIIENTFEKYPFDVSFNQRLFFVYFVDLRSFFKTAK